MKQMLVSALLFAGSLLMVQTPASTESADAWHAEADAAKAKGDIAAEANAWCQAATQDATKYGKKCQRTKADADKGLMQFKADLNMGQSELQQKDFAGALRDLEKITYGPNRTAAQDLIKQVHLSMGGSIAAQTNAQVLEIARAAYFRGDFDAAQAEASRVQAPQMRPPAQQILTNIRVYQATMRQADAFARNRDFQGAEQKYAFAAQIKSDGPGAPLKRVQQMQAAEAQVAQTSPKAQTPTEHAAEARAKTGDPQAEQQAIQKGLQMAKRSEATGDWKGAAQSYDAVLRIDGKQKQALAGKERVLLQVKDDPAALSAMLRSGIQHFYSSDFSQAEDEIQTYLQGGGKSFVGAAHFYLGAAFEAQSLLSSPKKQQANTLHARAQSQFELAKLAHYRPVIDIISPRILEAWSQRGGQQ